MEKELVVYNNIASDLGVIINLTIFFSPFFMT